MADLSPSQELDYRDFHRSSEYGCDLDSETQVSMQMLSSCILV